MSYSLAYEAYSSTQKLVISNIVLEILFVYDTIQIFAWSFLAILHNLISSFAEYLFNVLLKVSDARLATIMLNQSFKCIICQSELIGVDRATK